MVKVHWPEYLMNTGVLIMLVKAQSQIYFLNMSI